MLAFILFTATFYVACDEESSSTTSDFMVGSWGMNSFIKDADDMTHQFDGYTFICDPDGQFTIEGHGKTLRNCRWNTAEGQDSIMQIQIMGCENNSILWELEEDWVLDSFNMDHCYFSHHSSHNSTSMQWVKH